MATPLFPLHAVLFPGMGLPIHVFEPRYRDMMARVLAGDRTFGVVAIREGFEVGSYAETYGVGTLALVEQVHRFDDGRYALIARGSRRFRIIERLPDDPYPQGEVSPLDEPEGSDAQAAMRAARAALARYVAAAARAGGTEPPEAFDVPAEPAACSYVVAAVLQVDIPDRQRLLEAESAAARLRLAADVARREAGILETIGPPVGRPVNPFSGN